MSKIRKAAATGVFQSRDNGCRGGPRLRADDGRGRTRQRRGRRRQCPEQRQDRRGRAGGRPGLWPQGRSGGSPGSHRRPERHDHDGLPEPQGPVTIGQNNWRTVLHIRSDSVRQPRRPPGVPRWAGQHETPPDRPPLRGLVGATQADARSDRRERRITLRRWSTRASAPYRSELTADDLTAIETAAAITVQGERYPEAMQRMIDR